MKNTMADYKKFHTEVQLYEGPTWKMDNNGSGQGIEDLTMNLLQWKMGT